MPSAPDPESGRLKQSCNFHCLNMPESWNCCTKRQRRTEKQIVSGLSLVPLQAISDWGEDSRNTTGQTVSARSPRFPGALQKLVQGLQRLLAEGLRCFTKKLRITRHLASQRLGPAPAAENLAAAAVAWAPTCHVQGWDERRLLSLISLQRTSAC